MSKKAFTLTELLSVVVIIGLIALIVTPVVDKMIKESKENIYQIQIKNIEQSLKNWGADNLFMLPKNGETITLTFYQLKQLGYIDEKVQNTQTKKNFPNDMLLTIENKKELLTYKVHDDVQNQNSIPKNSNGTKMELKGRIVEYVITGSIYVDSGVTATYNDGSTIPSSNIMIEIVGESHISTETPLKQYTILYKIIEDGVEYKIARTVIIRDETNEDPQIAKDRSGAAVPKLHDNMIPIKYDGTKWVKADKYNSEKEWFDYENRQWANAVTVTQASREGYQSAAIGTPVLEADILTYMVWIPRYEYKIDGTHGKGGTNALNPGEIEINFTNAVTSNPGYIIHPSFVFGIEELIGFWVGKFELTGTIESLTIKPNIPSLRNQTVSSFFSAMRSLNNNSVYGYGNVDAHMIKNSEWGAVAYLSQSKYGKYGNPAYTGANKEIYQNKSSIYTGNSNGTVSTDTYNTQCAYDNHTNNCGIGASTTGNIYGVYDMSGGAHDYAMGNYNNALQSSGFTSMPEAKYYDLYTNVPPAVACFGGICFGHALSETATWYGDFASYTTSERSWILRGGAYSDVEYAGIFYAFATFGENSVNISSRLTHK